MINRLLRYLVMVTPLALLVSATAWSAERAPDSPYLQPVLACIETMLKSGTDQYGPETSPMFSSVLDLETHRLPESPPPLLTGQRPGDRAYPGANLQHALHTLLLMPHLSKLTSQPSFVRGADAYLEFFLRRCTAA